MRFRSSLRLSLLLFVTLVLTGCDPILRFYGSHDNVEAHHAQMRQAVERFEAALAHNQADLQRLTAEAATNPRVGTSAEAMAALVALQEAVLTGQKARLEELDDTGDYRDLNRAYGAMITEQQMIADRYAEVAEGLRADTTEASYLGSMVEKSRYVVVPPQYYRTNNLLRTANLNLSTASAQPAAAGVAPTDTVASEQAPVSPAVEETEQ